MKHINLQTPSDGDCWLMNQVQEHNTKRNTGLRIPTYFDKKEEKQANYQLKDLNDDQFHIAYYILKKIRE